MPETIATTQLQAIRDLLREGRTTEADTQIDALQEQIRQEAERIKRETPPPSPRTPAQLEQAFKAAVTDLLGNPPRLVNLLTEIEGQQKAAE